MHSTLVCVVVAALLATGCTRLGPLAPNPTKGDIARWSVHLSPEKARELSVWHDEHDNIWDSRVHSKDT
jgi:hypothetical protein